MFHALRHHVNADDFLRAELAAKRAGGQAYGAEAGDEHCMIAVDSDLLQALVHGPESACNLRAIGIREFIGQRDEVFLLGHHVLGHAAVALPAVGAAIFLAGAGDHVAAPAVVAHAASRDVIDNHPVA